MKFKPIVVIIFVMIRQLAAQQNWVAIPCYHPKSNEYESRMFVDSLHDELILSSNYCHGICNVNYKGVLAYNGNGFHDLDFGLDKFNSNPNTGGNVVICSIPYSGKTLFGGGFNSVGSDTLYSKSIALWNGAKWDTFPKHVFSNKVNGSGGGINGFLRFQNKLWMYGGFDTIGGVVAKNICNFDGNNFSSIVSLPVTNNDAINKMIVYKNKLIACGPFYDNPSFSITRVAMYDGTSWTSLGNGVKGSFSGVNDLVIYKDTLYIAGSWSKTDGNVSNHVMKWDGNQLHDAGFGNFYGWDAITSMAVYKDRLFAFGNFGHAANQKAWGVAYYQNCQWTVPKDSINNYGINCGVVYKDELYIAGAFKNINNDTTIKNFAKLRCPDFDAANGCLSEIKMNRLNNFSLKVFPNPVRDKFQFELENGIGIDKITLINTLGQEVLVLSKSNIEKESDSYRIDISFLASGIYYLKVQSKNGQGIFKIVKE